MRSDVERLRPRSDALGAVARAAADASEMGPIKGEFVAVICNGVQCFATEQAATLEDLLERTEGWHLSSELGGQDFCPRCAP